MLWSRWREKCTWAEGTGRVLWQQSGAEELRRRKQLRQFLATGVIAYHSDLCSHHCTIVRCFACSVASLDRFLGHQLPGHQSFRNDALANNLLGRGRPSTWIARLAWRRLTSEVSGDPVSSVLCGRRRFNYNNSGPIDSESAEDPWQAAIHWISHPQ